MLDKIGKAIESVVLGVIPAIDNGLDKFIRMIERNRYKAIAIFSLVVAGLIVILAYTINYEVNECEESGGEYKTSYNTSTMWIDGEMKVITTSSSNCIHQE